MIKRNLFRIICRALKVSEYEVAPSWLTWIFFPMKKYAINFACVQYDFQRDVYTINGCKISGNVFYEWGKKGIPEGGYFKLLRREKDGMIYLERFAPNTDFNLTQPAASQVKS